MEAIGKRIAALIRDKGLTNSQFAQEIDLNPSIVSHILSGRNKVSLQVVLQIKQAFPETDLQYLLTGEPAQPTLSSEFTNVNKGGTPSETQTPTPSAEKKHLEADPSPPSPSPSLSPSQSPSPSSPKQIERVLILYTDKSVESYVP